LIGHALTLCPPEQISDILVFSRELEAEQLLGSSLDYINVNITDKESGSILSHASSIKKSIQSFEEDELYGKEIRYCSNRKEVKDHGDVGILLGSKIKDGDKVVIIEDVTTSGKSIEETFPIIKKQGDVKIMTYGITK